MKKIRILKRSTSLLCALFMLAAFFAGQACGAGPAPPENILVTNFISEVGYSGIWDLEEEVPGLITEELVRRYQAIPVYKKRSWRDSGEDLHRKFPEYFIITGKVTDFGFRDNAAFVWPVMYKTTSAVVEIQLDIVSDGEVHSEVCQGEERKDGFNFELFGPDEQQDKDGIEGVKFGETAFWSSMPGKAMRKAIDKCMEKIEQYFPKE